MSIHCPACGQRYSQDQASGWVTCGACNHIWCVTANDERGTEHMSGGSRKDSPQPAAPAEQVRSGEYLPETGMVRQPGQGPVALTTRVGPASGVRAAVAKVLEQAGDKTVPPPSDEQSPVSTGASVDLFGQIEAQLDRERRENRTMEVPGFGEGVNLAPPPVADTGADDDAAERADTLSDEDAEQEPGADPFIGKELGGCLIDRKLGEGGMGSVYHAMQLRLERSVALKLLPPEMKRNTKFLKRFEHEAKALARINHPNILHIYDFGEDTTHSVYYMVMEFVAGEDMAELLRRRKRLEPVLVLDIVRQALLGLEAAAANGVVHRDIKPDNLMITAGGICKVSDFGLAKDAEALTQVTNMGVRVGTPAFMSPEQCDGDNLDFRSDVYSLGVTAYVGLTGMLPFSGESPFAIMLKHKTEPPPPVRARRPEVDERTDALVRRMMAKKPSERCQSLEQLRHEVEETLAGLRAGGLDKAVRPASERIVPAARFDDPNGDALPPLPADLMAARPSSPRPASLPAMAAPSPAVDFPAVPVVPAPTSWKTPAAGPRNTSSSAEHAAVAAQAQQPSARSSGLRSRPSLASSSDSGRRRADGGGSLSGSSRVVALEEEGDRHHAQGRWIQAIAAWQLAAGAAGSWEQRERLYRKVEGVRARRRTRRRRLLLLGALVLLGGGYAAGWYAAPLVHEHLVSRAAMAAEGEDDDAARKAAYDRLLNDYGGELWWKRIFLRPEDPPALERAIRRREQLLAALDSNAKQEQLAAELRRLKLAQETGSPWDEVQAKASALLQQDALESGLRPEVETIQREAAAALARIQTGLQAIDSARKAGQVEAVLRLAAELRRAGRLGQRDSLVPRLQDIQIVSGSGGEITGLRVLFDGHLLERPPERIYRYANEAVPLQLSAAGHKDLATEVPAGVPGADPLRFELPSALTWLPPLDPSPGQAAWTALHVLDPDAGTVIIHGDAAVMLLGADGRRIWKIVPADLSRTAPPDSRWTQLWRSEGVSVLLGCSSGEVARINLAAPPRGQLPVAERIPTGENLPVLDHLQHPMKLRADGQTIMSLLGHPEHARLLSRTSYSAANAATGTPQFLDGVAGVAPELHRQGDMTWLVGHDRIWRVDDSGRREGAAIPLAPNRTAGTALLDGGNRLALVAGRQLTMVDLTAGQDAAVVHSDGYTLSGDRVVGILATDGIHLLTHSNAGEVHLVGWDKDKGWKGAWTLRLPPGGNATAVRAVLGRDLVAIADAAGAIRVLRRADAQPVATFDHGQPTLALALLRKRLLVYDRNGRLAAYSLPER